MAENHVRGISTTLALLDKSLCEFEQWAKGYEIRSVLYQVINPLSQAQRQSVLREVFEMKCLLEEIRETLKLERKIRSAEKLISGSCSILWTSLVELEGRHLRRYGDTPSGLEEYLDPRILTLNIGLQRISSTVAVSLPP